MYLHVLYFPNVHTHNPMVILQSNDGNTLLLLLQRQWDAFLKIRNLLSAGSFQNCINNQKSQLGLESALFLNTHGAQSVENV